MTLCVPSLVMIKSSLYRSMQAFIAFSVINFSKTLPVVSPNLFLISCISLIFFLDGSSCSWINYSDHSLGK